MKIKSFYADSMDLALQNAGRELGEEALILNTREAPKEFRHFGKYEVVCAVADAPPPAAAGPSTTMIPKRAVAAAQLLFLVGPSGVGKSSSCAKIAIHSKFTLGKNPSVLSWDTGRVGGSEYLRAYCDIAGVPFQEVDSVEAFERALDAMVGADLILVDTPALEGSGVAQSEILRVLDSHPRAETHLVLSSTLSPAYLASSYGAYSAYRPAFLLPTHLDEARMDLSADGLAAVRSLTIRWCGTGRAIPEDIEDAGQVLEKAAALKPAVREPDFAIAAMEIAPASAPAAASARTAIDSILARFRRAEPEAHPRALNPSKSSAA